MSNLDRILELAGIKEKSFTTKTNHSLDDLKEQRDSLAQELKGSTILTEHVATIKYKLNALEKEIESIEKEGINEHLKKVDGKWAIVSKSTGKPLRYYKGEGKPSEEWLSKQEKSIEYFKNMKEETFFSRDSLSEEKSGEQLQDSQPSAAQDKDEVGNLFDDHDEEKDNSTELHNDAMGITQDRETKVTVPKDVFKQIDQRIKELEQSAELYDKTTYAMQYSNKLKAIENLQFIKEKLKLGNMEGYKQAQIHYGTLASMYAGNIWPAKLVDFLHDGLASEKKEVAYGDYMKGNPNKPSESEVPGSAIYKTLNTSIYPQKGEDNVPKKD